MFFSLVIGAMGTGMEHMHCFFLWIVDGRDKKMEGNALLCISYHYILIQSKLENHILYGSVLPPKPCVSFDINSCYQAIPVQVRMYVLYSPAEACVNQGGVGEAIMHGNKYGGIESAIRQTIHHERSKETKPTPGPRRYSTHRVPFSDSIVPRDRPAPVAPL